jgi:hypothetical protein
LLLFALGGVASADNAASISVAISYPCDQGEVCDDTGVAVSRSGGEFTEDGGSGDDVNIYITLLDANGNPATAGPNGENLDTLVAEVNTKLGTVIEPDTFLQVSADENVAFDGDSAARCYIDYTDAQVGTDNVDVIISGDITLVGKAQVNVVAPPAVELIVRTCADAPDTLYDEIEDPCNNGDDAEEAGSAVTFTVIANEGSSLYTTAPNMEGQQVTVCAYADYDAFGDVGEEDEEKVPVACGDFTMNDGIAQGSLTINRAGLENDFSSPVPPGLLVVFTATAEDKDGETVETSAQVDADNDIILFDWHVDTVVMVPGDPDAIKIAEDVFGNGNYIMEPDGNCLSVLDDAGLCGGSGTSEVLLIVIVDALGNAVDPAGDVTVTGTLEGILEAQLGGCETTVIGGYANDCTLLDDNSGDAGSGVIIGPLTLTAPSLDGDVVDIYLMPADDCSVIDLFVSLGDTAPIDAGDTVELTIESMGDTDIVTPGHDLVITGMSAANGMQLLSSDGCATSTTTLQINNVADADPEAAGLQVEIQVCALATTNDAEPVTFMVEDLDQCGASAMSDALEDVQPGEPVNLAVVALSAAVESESVLDETGAYVGTTPIVIDSYIIADGATYTTIVDADNGCCDLQVWDAFTNVDTCQPVLNCSTDSGNALPVQVAGCGVAVAFTTGAAGTSVTLTCGVDTDDDNDNDVTRSFLLSNIVTEIPEEGEDPGNPATALVGTKEGPQSTNGSQVNPPAGGEAIIRIGVNGDLEVSSVNVRIEIAEGSVAGAELRRLNGSTITLPLTISITDTADQRYVVYAPAAGPVTVTATEVSAEGLAPGSVTVVFGALCAVNISPANPTVATETTQQFTATTVCDGAAAPAYTWEIVAAETTGSTVCAGSTISATGLYTAAATETECVDTIKVTDTANGNATGETTVTVIPCAEAPVVTVTPASPACAVTEFCAATALCGASVDGTYTWTVTGGSADTTSGECITVTPEGTASFTVTATDTANGNAQGSASGDCVGIDATFQGCGRAFALGFGIVRIQGTGTNFGLLTIVQYDSRELIKGPRLVNRTDQTITQFVLLLPSFGPFLPVLLPEYPNTVEVTVTGLSDTFEIPSCR